MGVASCDAADPPPRAPTNGRPGFPHPGAGGRLPNGTAWAGFVAFFRPSRGSLSAIWRQVEKTTTRMCNSSSSSSCDAAGPGYLWYSFAPSTVRPWARGFCPHGRPGPLGFGLCGRLPRHGVGGFMFNSSSPSTCGILFVRKWGEGAAVTVQKGSVSFGQKRPRSRGEPSPLAGLCLPSAPGADQQPGGSAGSCSVCSAAARGGAAGPGSRIDNHRCRLGWEGAAKSGGRGAGFLFRRFAGAASADAMSSFGWGRRSPRAISTSSFGNSGGRRWPCREQLMFLLECFCEWNDTPGRGLVFLE